jgi:hypothetical protein
MFLVPAVHLLLRQSRGLRIVHPVQKRAGREAA